MLTKFDVKGINLGDHNFGRVLLPYSNSSKTRYNSFYIEGWDEKILVISHDGIISDVDKELTKVSLRPTTLDVEKVLDTLVIDDKLYISAGINDDNGCARHKVLSANLLNSNLEFKLLFSTPDCGGRDATDMYSGRMHEYTFNGQMGLLLSTSNHQSNQPTMAPQNDESSFGKILFLPLSGEKPTIFSKGHRNIQGLEVINDTIILATEHGPEGGDELNYIEFDGNYGWPIASYGGRYRPKLFASGNPDFPEGFTFQSDHSVLGFDNSIYSWLQSVGVSQLIYLPKKTIPACFNCVVVSSLNGRSVFIVNFSDDFRRIIFSEKVLVGERIRDMYFDAIENRLYLALEESAKILRIEFQLKER